jgi:hypothetical protein
MLNMEATNNHTVMTITKETLIKRGILRRCECGFETTNRQEFRAHLYDTGIMAPPMGRLPRSFGHAQNMKGREEAKAQMNPMGAI